MTPIIALSSKPTSFNRSFAFAAFMGAALFASPLSVAHAQTTTGTRVSNAQQKAAVQEDTVESRITTLHSQLKITPAEEPAWAAVAKTMRDNAAGMAKLAASNTVNPADMTAVQDLQTYETMARAHVDGLQALLVSFQALYVQMPDAQKKLADQVFQQAHQQMSNSQTPALRQNTK